MAGNRKVTIKTCEAFLAGNKLSMGNTYTDGKALFLHGNKIAEWRSGSVWVTNAGWNSVTTHERLSGLNCQVSTMRGQAYLNGKAWDGEWTNL